ncbi:hypothetical protein DSM112329_00589 [Paraconexibacter sp. AEG42_29]|uniref:Diguanylate cyclase n=1 Tax=Paraconexibacter sp. AEG42_29 TaxID=2997339 RepID=A0AAU7AQ72_9ACTN
MSATDDDARRSVTLAAIPAAALDIDASDVIAAANALAVELLGRDPTGDRFGDVVGCGPRQDLGHGRARWRGETRSAAGVPFVVDVSTTVRPDGSALSLLQEVPESVLLGDSAAHLDAAFDSAPIGMAFFDTEGRYIRVNRALCALLDRSEDELLGRRDSELTHADDRQSDVDAAWRILRGETDTWQTEKRFVRPDGAVVWAIANMSFLRDDDRLPLMWLGQFQDITGRKELEAQLRELAEQDPLTGVANRRRLDGALRDALALSARHGHGGALIYVDLNGFKAVNDSFGHDTGDALLRRAGAAMVARCRETDVVARVGGDEFAVLLPVATPHQARTVLAGLQDVLGRVAVEHAGGSVALAATLGLACFGPADRVTPAELMAAADRAMYAARVPA